MSDRHTARPGHRALRRIYLAVLFCLASCLVGCVKDAECLPGRAGCPCTATSGCEPGAECYWMWCWGGDTPLPDSYFYTQKRLEDDQSIRRDILAYMALAPGMKVADIGCGQGSYSSSMARGLGPDGVIYATDLDPRALDETRASVAAHGGPAPARLEPVLVSHPRETGLDGLGADTLDAILMINSAGFHSEGCPHRDCADAAENEVYLRRFRRVLAPGGRLIHHRNWILPHDLGREEVIALFGRAGFELAPAQLSMPARIPLTGTFYAEGPREPGTPVRRGFLLVFRKGQATAK